MIKVITLTNYRSSQNVTLNPTKGLRGPTASRINYTRVEKFWINLLFGLYINVAGHAPQQASRLCIKLNRDLIDIVAVVF
jgi:hypothetical protein